MRDKIRFYKQLLIEIVETLCTLCLFMETESRKYGCNPMYRDHFHGHFEQLKLCSKIMRSDKRQRDVIQAREKNMRYWA